MKMALALMAASLMIGGAAAAPYSPPGGGVYANSWDSDRFSTFKHVIEGPPGPVTLTLDARTTAGGGETVALYRTDANGERTGGRVMFVIATTNGNSDTGTLRLVPPPGSGPDGAVGTAPIMVVVENASGRRAAGDYRLTVHPAGEP